MYLHTYLGIYGYVGLSYPSSPYFMYILPTSYNLSIVWNPPSPRPVTFSTYLAYFLLGLAYVYFLPVMYFS